MRNWLLNICTNHGLNWRVEIAQIFRFIRHMVSDQSSFFTCKPCLKCCVIGEGQEKKQMQDTHTDAQTSQPLQTRILRIPAKMSRKDSKRPRQVNNSNSFCKTMCCLEAHCAGSNPGNPRRSRNKQGSSRRPKLLAASPPLRQHAPAPRATVCSKWCRLRSQPHTPPSTIPPCFRCPATLLSQPPLPATTACLARPPLRFGRGPESFPRAAGVSCGKLGGGGHEVGKNQPGLRGRQSLAHLLGTRGRPPNKGFQPCHGLGRFGFAFPTQVLPWFNWTWVCQRNSFSSRSRTGRTRSEAPLHTHHAGTQKRVPLPKRRLHCLRCCMALFSSSRLR